MSSNQLPPVGSRWRSYAGPVVVVAGHACDIRDLEQVILYYFEGQPLEMWVRPWRHWAGQVWIHGDLEVPRYTRIQEDADA